MRYIHTKPTWPHLTWNSDALVGALAGVRHRQGLLVGRLNGLGLRLRGEAGLAALTDEVVESSAIEGEQLPPEEVRSSIARRLGLDAGGLPPAGHAVEGIVEVLVDATQRYDQPVTAERLLGWHAALFPTGHPGRTGARRITVGAWRRDADGPMQVVSGALGAERVHFEAPAAERLNEEMARFLDWFNTEDGTDPVLRAGIAHFWFVTIHPFDDGNGRMARAIADLALARSDGRPERFYSMSSQISAERAEYYRQLETSQRGGTDITTWLEWFLGCLWRAIARAETPPSGVPVAARFWERANHGTINSRQHSVLGRMLGDWSGQLTTSKYAKLAKCSADTALRDITALVSAGLLVKNDGGGRSASYRLADDG